MKSSITLTLLLTCATSSLADSLLLNGDFETGNLSGWTTFVTPNGVLSPAWVPELPDVSLFDVSGTGTPSLAAKFQVGEANYVYPNPHSFEGGGIFQTFESSGGPLTFSVNVAAYNPNNSPGSGANRAPGVFSLLVDGVTLDSRNLYDVNGGDIQAQEIIRSSLSATTVLDAGTHELRLLITRDALANGYTWPATPYGYLDDIQVTPVPEPSTHALVALGTVVLMIIRRRR
jgi:hypothetical protein